jgi:hypothetical protein
MPRRTPSGRMTAVGDVESKLAREYGTSPEGKRKTYATLNKIGLMRGSKTTAKGMRAAKSKRGKR